MSPKEETKPNHHKPLVLTSASSSSLSPLVDAACHGEDEPGRRPQQSLPSFYYLNEDACRALPDFQYKGQDQSLLYAHVLSPLAQWCVDHWTPRWMAPNLITLIGLLCMVSSYAAMWYYVPAFGMDDEGSSPPRLIYLWNALCIFLYQTLDNIDGKQARRTKSSSPLGLLFDHGCDAVNSLFGSAGWMICMQLHPRRDAWECFIVLFGPYALFYIGTWEEYHTGQLLMPMVNGPNEGLLGAMLMSLTSYRYGADYWQQTTCWDTWLAALQRAAVNRLPLLANLPLAQGPLRNADLLVMLATVGFVQEVLQKGVAVVRHYGRPAMATLLPFATLVLCAGVVGAVDIQVWLQCPRTSLHLCATLFVEAVTDLMLQHTTLQPYQPVRWIQLPLVLLTAGVVMGAIPSAEWAQTYLMVYTSASMVYLAMKTRIIVHEICSLLNIWCFDIVATRRVQGGLQRTKLVNRHSKHA